MFRNRPSPGLHSHLDVDPIFKQGHIVRSLIGMSLSQVPCGTGL